MPRRVTLLYNPVSGRRTHLRRATIESIASALQERSVEVDVIATCAVGSAGAQARAACEHGTDIVFACGGDGTVHEALQGMVFQTQTALGVVPLGSANALARHLELPLDPVRAAVQQLEHHPRLIPVGTISYQTPEGERYRYFLVMAGAGPDGALVYKMLSGRKHLLGRSTYYLRAANLFLRSHFASFPVTCTAQESKIVTNFRAVSAMAVRVGDLGGLFSPLIRGGSVEQSQLLLTAVLPPARTSMLAWFVSSWMRVAHWNPYVRSLWVDSVSCESIKGHTVQVQADGEWLGRTPMTIEIVPNALQLLMPATHENR